MRYSGKKTSVISFPLGGIGSGSISLAGNGSLIDWEIFNNPAKGSYNGISHFAVRAEDMNGKVRDIRILNSDLPPHYIGHYRQLRASSGYGYGPEHGALCNLPHFKNSTFDGTFPTCRLEFSPEKNFPGRAALEAWSVFIPGESQNSSLPAAFFEIEIENDSNETFNYTALGVLSNPWALETSRNQVSGNQLTVSKGDGNGDLTLTLLEKPENFSYQSCLFRGKWLDHQEVYYRDLAAGGRLKERVYTDAPVNSRPDHGMLAAHFTLKPGGKKRCCFIISWNIPERCADWTLEERKERAAAAGIDWTWKNYYSTVWQDSRASGKFAQDNYAELRQKTYLFRDCLFSGTLPEVVKDAVSGTLAVLKSPVCMRLEDGTFYSFEGVGSQWGSCEGSCTHVFNYAQALPFLFPDLERSMRESHLKYSIDENGGSHFRLLLPLGIHAQVNDFRPCADGQFGDVMKIYRDWKIGGKDEYLRKYYPQIKKMIGYAWSDKNPDRWDPEETGVLHGRQHHTLDMELFGPNAWLTGHYLGALDAAARIADFMADGEFAAKCRKILAKGRKWVDKNLFNGEYFNQIVDLSCRSMVADFGADAYWDEEHGQIKYQIADGCGIDAVLAQNYASLYGLDDIFSPAKVRKTLRSIYKYNYRKTMRDTPNFWRTFCLNDEGGVMICTWPKGEKPVIPLTYNSEMMTGFEWAYITNLIRNGMVKTAMTCAKAVRDRYDGEKRNPYNEIECGSNYVRSMAAYGMLIAFAGFKYDYGRGMLGFSPRVKGDFESFWALGDAWGTFKQSTIGCELYFAHGSFDLKDLQLDFVPSSLQLNGKSCTLPLTLKAGDILRAVR
ncbi:MAG: hypothetical protein E7057_11075 [Lentisphaerae bacterium]|nr:hypothetical protein [Lentisphaerota bacterium]